MSEKTPESNPSRLHPKVTSLSIAFPMSIEHPRSEITTTARGPSAQGEGITRPPHQHFSDRR